MKMISHPHIVGVKEVFATSSKILMVLELVNGGELFDKIDRQGRLSEEQARYYLRQLCDGLSHCHARGICHRDLKPENLGLTTEGRLKLFDFGLCRCVQKRQSDNDAYEMTGNTGSLRYMAPEGTPRGGSRPCTVDLSSHPLSLLSSPSPLPPLLSLLLSLSIPTPLSLSPSHFFLHSLGLPIATASPSAV